MSTYEEEFEYILHESMRMFNINGFQFFDIGLNYKEPPFPIEVSEKSVDAYYRAKNNQVDTVIHALRNEIFKENYDKNIKIIRIIRNKLHNANLDILEYGCGNGLLAWRLSKCGWNVDAVDYISTQTRFLQSIVPETCKIIDKDDFRWDKQYDVVCCLHTIEHLIDPIDKLMKLMALVKIGGLMVLEYPAIWEEPETNPEHINTNDQRDMIPNMMRQNGFVLLCSKPPIWIKKADNDTSMITITRTGKKIDVRSDNISIEETYILLEIVRTKILRKCDTYFGDGER